MQNNKLLRGVLENDSIQHRHDPSTPKHNRSRKKIRRAVKHKERRELLSLNMQLCLKVILPGSVSSAVARLRTGRTVPCLLPTGFYILL